MTRLSDQLDLAGDYIEQYGWTQGAMARDECGVQVSAYSSSARKFCLMGAMCRAGCMDFNGTLIVMSIIGASRAAWNDAPGRKRSEVSKLLWDAADKARAEGS